MMQNCAITAVLTAIEVWPSTPLRYTVHIGSNYGEQQSREPSKFNEHPTAVGFLSMPVVD